MKDDAKVGTTKVKLENIEGGDISHSFPGNTKQLDIKIKEKEPDLSSIEIKSNPTKTTYKKGEKFDTTGLEVLANYENNTSALITDYTYTPSGELTENDTEITISYTKNGITKDAKVKINVNPESNNENNNNVTGSNLKASNSTETKVKVSSNLNEVKANSSDTSTANKILPKTGKFGIIAIVLTVSATLVVSIIKCRKYKGI